MPSIPRGLTATRISSVQINLRWTASTDDVAVREYRIERCKGTACTNYTQIAATTRTSFSNWDYALRSTTSFRYRIRAMDTSGNLGGYSARVTVSGTTRGTVSGTGSADTQPPTTPAGLTATRVSASQINIAWSAATDNVGVREYRVERCQGGGCTAFTQIASTSGQALANLDPALVPTASFSYRVRAVDPSGNLGGYSATATVPATSSGDTQAPSVPGGFSATRVSSSQISLRWTAATDNVGIREYRVERCQGGGCTAFTQIASTAGPALANLDPALVPTASFSYRVRAVDPSGNLGGYSATGTVAAQGTTTVNRPPVITGSPPATVVAGNAYAFTPTASDPDGQALTFSVRGAPAWATFSAATGALRGNPGSANVGRTDGIVITTTDGSNSVSLPAFSVNVVQVASGTATVSWTPPVQRTDGSALTNLAGYEIRYGTSASVLDRTIQLTNPGLASYVVQGLTSGTWYFGVMAVDSARLASNLSSVRAKTVP